MNDDDGEKRRLVLVLGLVVVLAVGAGLIVYGVTSSVAAGWGAVLLTVVAVIWRLAPRV